MEKKLLFYSNFNSYWYDGANFFERDWVQTGNTEERTVTRSKVLKIAKINNALKFMPLKCCNCGRDEMFEKDFQFKCERCGWIQKTKLRNDRWTAKGRPDKNTVEIAVDGIPRVSLMQEIVIHGLEDCDPVQVKEELLVGYFDVLEDLHIL